jgi:hypothetical protein
MTSNEASSLTDDLGDRALSLLASPHRRLFLATLLAELGLAGRATYQGKAMTAEAASQGLRCVNELHIVAAKQLRSELGPGSMAYPDEALVSVLVEKAAAGGCLEWLSVSLGRAITQVHLAISRDIQRR